MCCVFWCLLSGWMRFFLHMRAQPHHRPRPRPGKRTRTHTWIGRNVASSRKMHARTRVCPAAARINVYAYILYCRYAHSRKRASSLREISIRVRVTTDAYEPSDTRSALGCHSDTRHTGCLENSAASLAR